MSLDEYTLMDRFISAYSSGNYELALRYATEYIKRYPNNADFYFLRGQLFTNLERYQDAIEDLSKAIQLNPNDGAYYKARALAELELSLNEEALNDLNKAISLKPDYSEAYLLRGVCYSILDNMDKAVEDFKRTVEIDPKNGYAHFKLGVAQYIQGNLEESIESLTRAIDLTERDNPDAYYYRGLVYFELGQDKKALFDFSKAIELGVEDEEIYSKRAVIYYFREEFEKAIADIERAIKLNPNRASSYFLYGTILNKVERYNDALNVLNHAIKLDPELSESYSERGFAKFNLERYEEAIKDFARAIDLDPTYVDPYLGLGTCFASMSDFSLATDCLKKALEVNPEDTRAKELLSLVEEYKIKYKEVKSRWNSLEEVLKEFSTKHITSETTRTIPQEPQKESTLDKSKDTSDDLLDELTISLSSSDISSGSPISETLQESEKSITIGNYSVIKELYKTKTITTYLAKGETGELVIVKQINSSSLKNNIGLIENLLIEWKKKCANPILTDLVDYSLDDLFYVTEYAETTLEDTLDQISSMDDVIDTFIEITKLVDTFHNIFNKPHGLLTLRTILVKEKNLLLTDPFLFQTLDLSNMDLDLLQFLAPEQIDSTIGDVSKATDVWQLGVLFYMLLTKDRYPWGTTFEEVAQNILTGNMKNLKDVPSDVQDIIASMIKVKPTERPIVNTIIKKLYLL